MFLQLGSVPTLVVSSADMAKEIFKTHDITFSGRPALYAAKRLSYGCKSVSFAPYGDHWREIRKVMILELLGPKRVQSFQAARGEEVSALLAEIAQASSSSGSPVDLSELALSFANDVVCRVAFGKKYDASKRGRFREMLGETQSLLGGFCVADFFPWLGWINKMNGLDMRLEKCFGKLDKFYDEVIEEHLDPERPKAEHEDVVDVLLQLQKDSSQFVAVNNDQIKGVLTVCLLHNNLFLSLLFSSLLFFPQISQFTRTQALLISQSSLVEEDGEAWDLLRHDSRSFRVLAIHG